MENAAFILIVVAMILQPIWLLLSQILENNSIYPKKSDWLIGTLGILTLGSFVLGIVFYLVG